MPTTENNIRLRDIIINQLRDGLRGMIQYDLGKQLQNG